MNRRTLLSAAGGLSAFGLVSFFIYEFTLSMPVLIFAKNETDEPKGVVAQVHELDTDRQTLKEEVTAPSGVSTQLGRVPNTDAQVTIDLVELVGDSADEDAVIDSASTFVDEDTKSVTARITEGAVELELSYRE